MNKKAISYNELKKAIYTAFDGDSEIFSMYDPNKNISSIEELSDDIFNKIKEYDGVSLYSVYENEELIGYFANVKNRLVSFGISMKYRLSKYLKEFFEIIKNELGKNLFVYLWQANKRAIQWMKKNGLVEEYSDNFLIKLQCQ